MKAREGCGEKRTILHTGRNVDWHSHYALAHPKYWIGKKKSLRIVMLREDLNELFGQPSSMAVPQKTKTRVAI